MLNIIIRMIHPLHFIGCIDNHEFDGVVDKHFRELLTEVK